MRRLGFLLLLILMGAPAARALETLELVFVYESEKDTWLSAVTSRFNDDGNLTPDGKLIRVSLRPSTTGDVLAELREGSSEAHLVSPASSQFLRVSGEKAVGWTRSLVQSPVVIAMWPERARALGWPAEPLGWRHLLFLAGDERGWAGVGHPEWGRFKFRHPHPLYNLSGLYAVIAQAYASAEKVRGLTGEDVTGARPMLGGIGRSIVYYGNSLEFFESQMPRDPSLIDAAVLSENMVFEHNSKPGAQRLVAIYPKEGTFMNDHPVGVVDRPWVTPEHREAADRYIRFLLDEPQQRKALELGLRPGAEEPGAPPPTVKVGAPIDAAHGLDPAQPATLLDVPPLEVVQACLDAWHDARKPVNVVLAIDVSASMAGEKITKAVEAAQAFVDRLGDRDSLSILAFNSYLMWWTGQDEGNAWSERTRKVAVMGSDDNRARAKAALDRLKPAYQGRLHEAVLQAHAQLVAESAAAGSQHAIACLVVLSDGKDLDTRPGAPSISAPRVVETIRTAGQDHPVLIFTIGCGIVGAQKTIDAAALDQDALKKFAAVGGGSYQLTTADTLPDGFERVLQLISSK